MLRPATPLSILLLVSFVLLLLSVLSAPIVHSFPLATFEGYNFGVFGYCKADVCSSIRVGYTTDGLFGSSSNNGDFNLPSSARHSLSSILIVHPVAAFFNLVCLGLAVAAHFHSPSHSARYLLGLLILLLPTLLVTLLAFLVDILLFVPHLQWGGWIVLASTILITASGVVTCAMRRTLVSRKARKRRIAENAEMSGENYYARQAQESKLPIPPPLTAQTKAPMVNGAPGADNLPPFAAYDASRAGMGGEGGRAMNSAMASGSATAVASRPNGSERYGGPPSRSRSQPPYSQQRDVYGNPVPNEYGAGPSPVVRNRSEERRGPTSYRDEFGQSRGGYGQPRGRGGYPPRGSFGPRGGYGGPGSRGPPPQSYAGRGGLPPGLQRGFGDRGRGGFAGAAVAGGMGGAMATGVMMNRGARQPPPSYPPQDQYDQPDLVSPVSRYSTEQYDQRDDAQYQAQPASAGGYEVASGDQFMAYGARAQSPARERQSPYGSRRQSPAGGVRQHAPAPPMPNMPNVPVGQAVEMDAVTGHQSPVGYGPPHGQLRDSDADVQGMVGLQQNRQEAETGGMYSNDGYVPPRQAWSTHHATTVPNSELANTTPATQRPQQSSPVELASANSNIGGPAYSAPGSGPNRHRVNSGGSDIYYEDVNPRFAPDAEPTIPGDLTQSSQPVPSLLQPGARSQQRQFGPSAQEEMLRPVSDNLDPTSSYEDLQQGARSPAESETSNFTSVSQRGVNPNWRPGVDGPGAFGSYGPGGGAPMGRKPVGGTTREQQRMRDVLLAGNPDFEIPGMGPTRRGRGGGGMGRGGGRMPGGMSTISGDGGGRYPTP